MHAHRQTQTHMHSEKCMLQTVINFRLVSFVVYCVHTERKKPHERKTHPLHKTNQPTKNPPLSVQMIDDINYAVRMLSTSCFSSSLLLSTNNYVFQLLCHMYATNYPTITQASLSPWHYTASLMQHKENSHTRTAVKLDPRHQIDGFLRSDF